MLTDVELNAVLVVWCSQLTGEVHIIVYDLVRDWNGTRYIEGIMQVVQMY